MKRNINDEENSSTNANDRRLDDYSFENENTNFEMQKDPIVILEKKIEELYTSIENLTKEIRTTQISLNNNNQSIGLWNQKTNSLQNKIDSDMNFFKNKSKERIENLEKIVNSQNETIRILEDKINQQEKNIAHLIGYITNLKTSEKREKSGGQITVMQHQDLLQTFKELSNTTDSLSNEIIPKNNDLVESYRINASLVGIFYNDLEYTEWLNDVFNTGNLKENIIKFEEQTNKTDIFKKYYDDVVSFKTNMQHVKPNATLYLPKIGNPFNKLFENLVSGRCDETKMISILVYPGYLRGDKIDEKAKVYTGV